MNRFAKAAIGASGGLAGIGASVWIGRFLYLLGNVPQSGNIGLSNIAALHFMGLAFGGVAFVSLVAAVALPIGFLTEPRK